MIPSTSFRGVGLLSIALLFSNPVFSNPVDKNIILNDNNDDYSILITQTGSTDYTIQFQLKDISFIEDAKSPGNYFVDISGFNQNSEPGTPSIPQKVLSLNLPTSSNCKIQLMDSVFSLYDYELTASIPLCSSPDCDKDIPIINPYNGYSNYGILTECLIQTYRYNHNHYFLIKPVNYNYSAKKVRVCDSFTAKVSYDEAHIDNTYASTSNTFKNSTENNLTISEDYDIHYNIGAIDVTEDYLILSMAWLDSVDVKRFAEWKRTQGYRTHIEYRNRWTPEEVNAVVKSYYHNPDLNLNYLLILSTHDNIPGVKCDFLESNYSENEHIPSFSDMPYACMDGDSDYTPDIYYGRVGVYTNDMIKTVVDKWIKYQKDPIADQNFYKNSFVCAYYEPAIGYKTETFDRYGYIKETEIIKKYLEMQGKSVKRTYATLPKTNPQYYDRILRTVILGTDTISFKSKTLLPQELQRPNFSWDNDSITITETFNEGHFLGIYNGHGSWHGWNCMKFSVFNPTVGQINNGFKQPLLLCATCSNGDFYNHYSFAYELSRREQGCMGVIACSAKSFTYHNRFLLEGMINYIFSKPGLRSTLHSIQRTYPYNICQLGEILRQGLSSLSLEVNDKDIKTEYAGYHVFGDPSSQFFTETPKEFSSPDLIFNGSSLNVRLNPNDMPAYASFYEHKTGNIKRFFCLFGECSFIPESDSITSICLVGRNKKPLIINFNQDDYILDANINPDIKIIKSAIFNPIKSSIEVTLNLNCSEETWDKICDNGLSLSINRLGEKIKQYISISHETHKGEVILTDPINGIYIISAKNKTGKILDSYKLKIEI